MRRFPDWEPRLHAFCKARLRTPFSFGSQDCALFVADAVLATTGIDIAVDARGQYADRDGANRFLSVALGGHETAIVGGLEPFTALVADRNSMQEVGVRLARRGDMVLMHQKIGPSLGIVSLDGMRALFAGVDGLERFAVLDCARAWRV